MRDSTDHTSSRRRSRDRSPAGERKAYKGREDRSGRDDHETKHRRRHDHERSRERSPRYDRVPTRSRSPIRRSKAALPSQDASFRQDMDLPPTEERPAKQMPNYKPTGLLAKEANTVIGTTTVLKYHEPPEARKPPTTQQWRMYVFAGKDLVDTIYLFQRSCWLIGRDQKVTDLYLEHSSISKQHAVIQFRFSSTTNEFGDKINKVKPYLIDLESANGTKLNDKPIDNSRYVQLVDGDVVTFGDSEREYVMMLPVPDKK